MSQHTHEGVRSRIAIKGHPTHPIFVTFPIAFWTGALIADFAYLATAQEWWAQMSFWLIVFGLIGAALAAVTGLVDFIAIARVREHAAGWIHAIGNVIAAGLAMANWLVRIDAPAAMIPWWGLALSIVTVLLVMVTGWYGGELAYRHKVGVVGHE